MKAIGLVLPISIYLLGACSDGGFQDAVAVPDIGQASDVDLRTTKLQNPLAYIPSQCFTKTEDKAGRVHNPCYSCHIASEEPNYLEDQDLQTSYDFPGLEGNVLINPWSNLFKDRTATMTALSEQAIFDWIRADNYLNNGIPILATSLSGQLNPKWDVDGNGRWGGYVPDAYFRFDSEGFDRTPNDAYSGWRAFAYTPFLGTFWPTNGSTDDVLIRLPSTFQNNGKGEFDLLTYKINLAIVSALIQRRDVPLPNPVDEATWQVDLDKDGHIGMATFIRYDWAPLAGRQMSYVGQARIEQMAGRLHLAAGLYPEDTEFLHSVRYLDIGADNAIKMAAHLKELRYAKKVSWYTYSDLKEMALKEIREKNINPERTRSFTGNAEIGVANGQGWTFQGFIEDKNGALRPQSYEETVSCMGCHSGIGATTDSTFAFPRKVSETAFQQGWYHWGQKPLLGMKEPRRRDGEYEYSYYLKQNGAGDEFRENTEVMAKFFNPDGSINTDKLSDLHLDVTTLILPSRQRAMSLNRAYMSIVKEQSFALGRDPVMAPVENVHKEIRIGSSTKIRNPLTGP